MRRVVTALRGGAAAGNTDARPLFDVAAVDYVVRRRGGGLKRRVDVTVMGLPLSVRTERDDVWVHGLAAQVGRRVEELRRSAKNATAQQLAVLVALNLAEELQQEREKTAELADVANTTLTRVRAALEALDDDAAEEVVVVET